MSSVMVERLRGKRRPPRKTVPHPFEREKEESGGPADRADRDPEDRSVDEPSLPIRNGKLGVLLLLGAVTMMFVAFTSTYIARMDGIGWAKVAMPPILWGTTAIILLSSGTLAWAKRALRADRRNAAQLGLAVTLILGMLFVAGQWLAWQELITQGIYLQVSAHAAFFYLLTAVHALHVTGGLIGLLVTLLRNRREQDRGAAFDRLDSTAVYWHFVDGLWVYLFLLLFFV